ncbi:lysophospholipid acyltransferase [Arachnomyces sp. PD_36]|nr:lysophospholipid acyltransferase [Arachnomyces sp. PD_36]
MLPYINTPFEPLAGATGASIDELKLISSFLLSYPLAAILKRIPDSQPWKKNLFIVAASAFYLVGMFDLWDGVRTILYSSIGTYAIAYFVDGSLMPWLGFFFLMGHMSIGHLYRQWADDPSTIDVTGAQMVLVMKLSAFCWNVHDGRLPSSELSSSQKHAAITELPSALDFAGYVFFFPSLFGGPAFDYNDFRRWIDTSMFEVPPDVDPSKVPPTRKKRKIPRSGTPAAKKAAVGLIWIFMFLQFSGWFYPEAVVSDDFMAYGFLRRVWTLYMLGVTTRMKYYGVWSLSEGSCILSGLGYNGFDPKTGRVSWNKLENINPWNVETAQNSHAYLGNWNKNTNHWLRNYVYLRVTPKGKKPGFRASLATFATSAFWHGFYPGYYLTFILASFIQTAAKKFRRHVRPFFLTPDGTSPTPYKPYYDFVTWLTTQLVFAYTVMPFVILGFNDSIRVWSHVYYYGIISVALSLGFFASPGGAYLHKRLKERNHPKLQRSISEESIGQPTLGLPNDPGRDIDEAVEELKGEIEAMKKSGQTVSMPSGEELKAAIEEKLGKKL